MLYGGCIHSFLERGTCGTLPGELLTRPARSEIMEKMLHFMIEY